MKCRRCGCQQFIAKMSALVCSQCRTAITTNIQIDLEEAQWSLVEEDKANHEKGVALIKKALEG